MSSGQAIAKPLPNSSRSNGQSLTSGRRDALAVRCPQRNAHSPQHRVREPGSSLDGMVMDGGRSAIIIVPAYLLIPTLMNVGQAHHAP